MFPRLSCGVIQSDTNDEVTLCALKVTPELKKFVITLYQSAVMAHALVELPLTFRQAARAAPALFPEDAKYHQ